IGTTGDRDLDTLSEYYSGAMYFTTRAISNGAANTMNGYRFEFRNKAVDWTKGLSMDWEGSPTIRPINGHEYNYDLGNNSNMFRGVYTRNIYGSSDFQIRNYYVKEKGWLLETDQSGGYMTFRGINGGSYSYNLGGEEAYNHFSFGYINYLRPKASGSGVGSSDHPYRYGHIRSLTVHDNLYAPDTYS